MLYSLLSTGGEGAIFHLLNRRVCLIRAMVPVVMVNVSAAKPGPPQYAFSHFAVLLSPIILYAYSPVKAEQIMVMLVKHAGLIAVRIYVLHASFKAKKTAMR